MGRCTARQSPPLARLQCSAASFSPRRRLVVRPPWPGAGAGAAADISDKKGLRQKIPRHRRWNPQLAEHPLDVQDILQIVLFKGEMIAMDLLGRFHRMRLDAEVTPALPWPAAAAAIPDNKHGCCFRLRHQKNHHRWNPPTSGRLLLLRKPAIPHQALRLLPWLPLMFGQIFWTACFTK
nr:unnamed protein product [Digitaria exilis]